MSESATSAPLRGVRVVDLSRVLAGPFCTALLGDAGADIIKVEPPAGDDARHLGPFRGGESLYFHALNRGKRSIALDLKNPDDHQALLQLCDTADVVVENFRPGVAHRLGIDAPVLRERNPRLVYTSVSGFGQQGPLSGNAAYDLVVQALSGIMSITGSPDGEPTRIGESYGDLLAGLFAAWGTSTALLSARDTGIGRHVDVAMLDSMLALLPTAHSMLQADDTAPGRVGNRHPVSTPFATFRAADAPFALAVPSETGFAELARVLDDPELTNDPRFADDPARTRNEPALRRRIEHWAQQRSAEQAVAELREAGLAASPVHDVAEALSSPHARHRGVVRSFDHPRAGRVDYVGQPVVFGNTPRPPAAASPDLDEHRAAVLAETAAPREA